MEDNQRHKQDMDNRLLNKDGDSHLLNKGGDNRLLNKGGDSRLLNKDGTNRRVVNGIMTALLPPRRSASRRSPAPSRSSAFT